MSRSRSSRSSSYGPGLRGITEYDAAAAYGEPALSDASSDEQIARAISESKRTAFLDGQRRSPAVSRAYSYASSSASTLLGSGSGSNSPYSQYTASPAPSQSNYGAPPTPTPRYAADEVIARNLARSWRVASVQSDLIADPRYTRPATAAGPPLVVRAPSPSHSIASSSSSQRTAYQSPSRPLSPLLLPTRPLSSNGTSFLRTPSVRSIASISSVRSAASASSARSGSSVRSTSSRASTYSFSSLLSSVTRSSRHAPLDTAAHALRASLPPSLARSSSSAASRSSLNPRVPSRASSVRSTSTVASSLSARGITVDEKQALARLHALATSSIRCTNPGCGAPIPPAALDSIAFPTVFTTDASPPRALFAALHARCPACTQSHCRGCGLPTGCDANCCGDAWRGPGASTALIPVPRSTASSSGSATPRNTYNALYPPPPCPVPSHCPAVRALGALAALISFDRAHIAMGATGHNRAADKPLIAQLHALIFFLAPPALPFSPHGSGPLLLSADDEDGMPPPEADAALPALLGLSRVPAYAASLLRAGAAGARGEVDVGGWMARAPAYGAVLRVLRALGDAGCQSVLARPVHAGAGSEAWFRRGASGGDAVWRDDGEGETLRGLIRRLESARVALLRLAGATTFGPTVEKAHALCDGVLYLLLQDVLGEDEGG